MPRRAAQLLWLLILPRAQSYSCEDACESLEDLEGRVSSLERRLRAIELPGMRAVALVALP